MAGTGPAMTKVAMINSLSSSIAIRLQKLSWFGAAILLAGLAPALAADPKPDFAVKAKFIDASVALDAAIKSNAALAANCLAEGKRWVEKNRADAAKEFKSSPEFFRDGAWAFERSYAQASLVDSRYVSVVRTDYAYTGGAHPNTDIDTVLWDDNAKKRISIRPFFKETADNGPTLKAMRSAAIAAVKAEKKARGIDDDGGMDWYKGIEPKLLKVGAVTLAASTEPGKSAGLEFHYPPYAVGPYAEGSFVVAVPWQALKPYLSAEGTAIFAGQLPSQPKQDR